MLRARHRPLWVVRSLVITGALAAAAVVWRGHDGHGAVAPAAGALGPPPWRACVTHADLCPVGLVRDGDPCSCPDPVAGNVPGHVEPVEGGAGGPVGSRDWPDGDAGDPLGDFGPLMGP